MLQQTNALYIVNRKKPNSYQCFCFLLIFPDFGGKRSQNKPSENFSENREMLPSHCLLYSRLLLVCNTRMSGYIPKHRQPLAVEALTHISFSWWLHLESASPSSCSVFCGTCCLSGTLQCSCSTTACFQPHQARSGFPAMQLRAKQALSFSSLCSGLFGKREVGTTNPAIWIYILVLLHALFCSLLEVILYILLLNITFYNVCLVEMNLHACWSTSGYCRANRWPPFLQRGSFMNKWNCTFQN